jgi:hypothetical protein
MKSELIHLPPCVAETLGPQRCRRAKLLRRFTNSVPARGPTSPDSDSTTNPGNRNADRIPA